MFIVTDILTSNVILSILSIIITYLIIVIFYDVNNVKKTKFKKLKFNKNNVLLIFKMGIWTFLLTLLTQYVINAPKYAIDNYLSNSSQTIYGIIVMPATLVILCGQFLIHPFLNDLTDKLKNKKIDEFNKIIFKLIFLIFIMGLIIVFVSYFIGIPFLEIIYGISLKKYLKELIIILLGATLFGISFIISNALITLRDTFSQVIIFGIASIFSLICSNVLVKNYNLLGAALTYFLTMFILTLIFICYYIYVKRRMKISV
jgi:O-antigen/teichoic acid export membrane protein